jgi:inosose dehydratase
MLDRLAAAPISWGICEVPGWGLQMSPRRVLGEMAELGITATELGALGWLPDDQIELRALLDEFGLRV